MAATTGLDFNIGTYRKMNKSFFLNTTNMTELKLYLNGQYSLDGLLQRYGSEIQDAATAGICI